MISPLSLATFPPPDKLKSICQSIAMLDAILQPEWEFRYFSFNSAWDDNQTMASMRDGSGNEYFIVFSPYGTLVIGQTHESPVAGALVEGTIDPRTLLDQVPIVFAEDLKQGAFSAHEAAFFLWQFPGSPWEASRVETPEGVLNDYASDVLFALDGNPETYQKWAEEYYEEEIPREIPLESVASVYQHSPLTARLIHSLNPEISMADLEEDIKEIGYPTE